MKDIIPVTLAPAQAMIHLGSGTYAEYNGACIMLTVEDHVEGTTAVVTLDAEMLAAFLKFVTTL